MLRLLQLSTTPRLLLLLVFLFSPSADSAWGINQIDWERSAYRIKIHLAVDGATNTNASSDLSTKLAAYLEQRIDSILYPLWVVEFSQPTGPFRHQLLTQIEELTATGEIERATTTDNSSPIFDKHIYLVVIPTPSGFMLKCRELDNTVQILGPVISRQVKQRRMLAEHCLKLVNDTFAPLAMIRRLKEDPLHVSLLFKGSSLEKQGNQPLSVPSGNIFLPLRIRLTRAGQIRPGGISAIPWTYLELEDASNDNNRCRIHSSTKHPFGLRRRGRVENLAIAMRHPPESTRVRFYAQHNKSQSLMGYEVFRREPDSKDSQLVGFTDNRGAIEILPGTANITTLFLRSGNELLAKVPVVPGASTKLEIPIADDIARLNAQASLTSLREQLIDLVARRNILIARARDRIEQANYEEAKEMLSKLDELPGRAQFAQSISSAQNNRRNRSEDSRIQARIDKMFADMRRLLGRFLDTRPATDLQDALNAARKGAKKS